MVVVHILKADLEGVVIGVSQRHRLVLTLSAPLASHGKRAIGPVVSWIKV